MRTTFRILKQLWMTPLAVAMIAGPATTAVKAADPAPAKKPETPQKAIAFQMNNQPWDRVLEWLTEQTGVPFVGKDKPTGSFTFISPKDQKYTLPQIIDILNEALSDQKWILIRKPNLFMIIPADKPPDPYTLPTLTVDQLAGHGDSEMVNCVITPKTLVAEDLAPELRRLMGHFGTAHAIADANELVVMDTVGDIRRINDMIKDIEKNSTGQQDSFSHKCIYIRARDAEAILSKLLGDPKDTLKIVQERTQAARGGNNRGGGNRGGFNFPGAGGGSQGGNNNQQNNLLQQATANIKVRMWYVSYDDRTNTVLVTGPANKLALAKSLIEKIDVPDQDGGKLPIGPRFLKSYSVANGDAKAVAAMLKDAFKGSTITEAGNDTIIVWGTPADQMEIAKQILGDQQIKTEVIPVTTEDPAKVASMLKGMFGEAVDSKTGAPSGAPYIDAHPSRNAITVHGTADQVAQVRAAMRAIGEEGEASGPMRIITLDSGSATTLAEELGRMLGRMRKNPVEVIVPGRGAQPKKPAPAPTKDATNQKTSLEVDNGPLVDPQLRAVRDTRPGDESAPVELTPLGNKVFVHSNDSEALRLAQELTRLLTTAPTGKGDFEIIPLKNGNAVSVAKILDDLFNGPKQAPLATLSGPAARARGIMMQQQPDTKPETIRVVADPASNSLLVQASPLNMATVRRLLAEALDTADTDSNAVLQTFIIPLQYAQAKEVEAVIKDVYKEHLNTTTDPSQLQGRPAWRAAMANAANGTKEVTLSVGVDERTNSLVVNCSSTLYKDIAAMVEKLDKGARDTARTVKVVPLSGVDPIMMQQILDLMQGRATPSSLGSSLAVPGGLLLPSVGNFNTGFMPPQGYGLMGGRTGPPRQGQPPTPGGRGFFEQRVKDDPQPSVLYDPQHEESAAEESSADPQDNTVVAQRPAPGTQPGTRGRPPGTRPTTMQNPLGPGTLQVPAGEVQVVPLTGLGGIMLSGSPLDVAAMERLILTLQRMFAAYEARLQLVYLKSADATAVANQLSQLFSRVIIGPTFTSIPTTVQQNVATPFGQQSISTSTSGSVVLQPLPRLNAIYVAAPKSRIADIVRAIQELDRPTQAGGEAHAFQLKHAAASRVATLLSNFYAIRYPGPANTTEPDQVRITYDDFTNQVFVQAAPSDLTNITQLIWQLDNNIPAGRSDVHIIPLRNVLSDDLAATLTSALSQEIVAPTTGTTGTVPRAPGGFGGAGATPGLTGFGSAGTFGGAGLATSAAGIAARAQTLRFISTVPGAPTFESGQLQDIKIISDPRINALLVFAPEESMGLMLSMIQSLDVLPALRAEVNIFTLKKADATATASVLQQLFLGTSSTTGGTGGITGGGIGGITGGALGGAAGRVGGALGIGGGGIGGLGTPSTLTATAPAATAPTLGGAGATAELLPPRITVDQRTNSVIVAAARHDLDLIEALVSRLEDTNVAERMNQVYKLRNAAAADVANSLNSFLTTEVAYQLAGYGSTPFNYLTKEVVVVPEPVSNQLIISATPQWFPKIMSMIVKLDEDAPQVVVQALLAEVDLTNTEEFGVELGLQSPVLFDRSIIPANGFLGTGSVTYDNAAGTVTNALVPPSVTVNSSTNPAALPGYNFNTTAPLPNNPVVNPSQVGFQGLTNLGVGRASPTSGVGGFVFSASSDAVSVLVRALQTQGRIDVLSRPQITTLDGQSSSMLVGQSIPYISGTSVSLGVVTPLVAYRDTGVLLRVTPRISPDGKIIMRVHPEVSSLASSTINLGNGVLAPEFNDEYVDTTITCGDGETVVIGGLISKSDTKNENKVPWLGDLPGIGALFRYRTEAKSKSELLVILTSHIVRNRMEADAVLAEEAQRMDWVLGDVLKTHGTSGMEPVMPPPPAPTAGKDCPPPAPPGVAFPSAPIPEPQIEVAPPPDNILPAPRPVPPAAAPGPVSASPPLAPDDTNNAPVAPPVIGTPMTNGQVNTGYLVAPEQGTEVHVWRPSNSTTATSSSPAASGN